MGSSERKNRIMVTDIFQGVERVSYVPDLCKKRGLSMSDFVREVGFLTKLSRPTLEKAYKGNTDLDYDVIEKLAWYFDVGTNKVIESKF